MLYKEYHLRKECGKQEFFCFEINLVQYGTELSTNTFTHQSKHEMYNTTEMLHARYLQTIDLQYSFSNKV